MNLTVNVKRNVSITNTSTVLSRKIHNPKILVQTNHYHMWCTDSNCISNSLWCIHVWVVSTEWGSVNGFHSICNSWIL